MERGSTLVRRRPFALRGGPIERLFPLTFEEIFLSSLSSRVRPALRAHARPLCRHCATRAPRGAGRRPRSRSWTGPSRAPASSSARSSRGSARCGRTSRPTRPGSRSRRHGSACSSRAPACGAAAGAAMTGRATGTVARAALAGALAMAVFGAVEIWFTELSVWAFHRAAFAPLDGRFAAALFSLYPLAGALGAGLVALGARAVGRATDARAAGALVVVVAHGVFRTPAYAGGSLGPPRGLERAPSRRGARRAPGGRGPGASAGSLPGPGRSALLLCAPVWVMTDVLAEEARGVRALGFAAAACAIVAASLRIERAPGAPARLRGREPRRCSRDSRRGRRRRARHAAAGRDGGAGRERAEHPPRRSRHRARGSPVPLRIRA